jgi:defect-in-organelle-trafficking protein DotB
MTFDEWPLTLMHMVPKYGKTMERAAREAMEAGLIERRYYLIYAAGTKEAKEAQAAGELDDIGGH